MTTMLKKDAPPAASEELAAKLEYEITAQELKEQLERESSHVFLVDIRRPEEYAAGHVPQARNIPVEELGESYGRLPKDALLVIYCGGAACGLSLLATLELAGTGFHVKRLSGGLQEWRQSGFEVQFLAPV